MNDHRDRKSTTLLHKGSLLEKEANQKTIEANDRTIPVTSQLRLRMLKRQVPFPTISNAGDLPAYKEVRTRIMHTKSVNSRINQPLHNIPMWERLHQSVLNGPITIQRQNEVVHQSYQNRPIKMVQPHHHPHSQIRAHAISVIKKDI